jgi:hypothetical protein
MEIPRERCEGSIIREPLEEFADVCDPERTLKAGANLAKAFGKSQPGLLNRRIRTK